MAAKLRVTLLVVVAKAALLLQLAVPAARAGPVVVARRSVDCYSCLLNAHSVLYNAPEDACSSLLGATSACLSGCDFQSRAEISFALLVDIYDALRTSGCEAPGCSPALLGCFDSFVVRRTELLSSSVRCGNDIAFNGSLSCLLDNQSPNCSLNSVGSVASILSDAAAYLCDSSRRCYDYGNVFELVPGTGCRNFTLRSVTFTGATSPIRCQSNTAFDTASCTCNFDNLVNCSAP